MVCHKSGIFRSSRSTVHRVYTVYVKAKPKAAPARSGADLTPVSLVYNPYSKSSVYHRDKIQPHSLNWGVGIGSALARCENNASLALRGPPALSQVRSATRAPPCRRLMKESARVFKGNVRSDDWTRVVRPVAASGRALEEISAAAAPGLRRRRSAPNVIHGSGGSCGTPRAQIV